MIVRTRAYVSGPVRTCVATNPDGRPDDAPLTTLMSSVVNDDSADVRARPVPEHQPGVLWLG